MYDFSKQQAMLDATLSFVNIFINKRERTIKNTL